MEQAKRILIAEDLKEDIELIGIVLKELGLDQKTKFVQTGAEVLDYLFCRGEYAGRIPGDPEMIFLDLKLPKLSGIEVLKEIQGNTRLRRVPVVVFSSSLSDKDREESLANGAVDFVVKPFGFEAFRDAIALAIKRYLKKRA